MAEDRKPARGKAPVSWHPLFPAIVALWFGALFGLGTLAIRTSLLESLAAASGIAAIVPSAAPPLGTTARLLIAVGLALLGGVIGGTIGTLMARSKPSVRARRAEAAEAKAARAQAKAAQATAPIVVAERVTAPAAAEAPSFIDIAALDLGADMKIDPEPFIAQAAAALEDDVEAEPALEPLDTFERPLAPALAPTSAQTPVSFPLPDSFPAPGGAAAARLTSATLDSLSHVELIERLALSLQKRRDEAGHLALPATLPADFPEGESDPAAEPDATARAVAVLPHVPSYYPPAPDSAPRIAPAPAPDVRDGAVGDVPESATTEPVALFRDQTSAPVAALRRDSVATERALRDALAALQRMSGAA